MLLKHIIGLLQPDAGEILLYGQPSSKMKPSQINRLRTRFSYVFQDAALFDSMTVSGNIALPLLEGASPAKSEIRACVEDRMQQFELQAFGNKYPAELSGGMKRRVAGQTILRNFAAQIKQRLDITDSCSRYSLDRILVVLQNADIEDARRIATSLRRELRFEDLLTGDNQNSVRIWISATIT